MWLSSADLSWCDLNVRFSLEILLVLLDNHLTASLVPVCFQNTRCNFPGGRTKPKGHKLFHVLSKAASAEYCCTKLNVTVSFVNELKPQWEFSCIWIIFPITMIYLRQHFCQQTEPRRGNSLRAAWVIPSTEVAFSQHASDAFFCLPSRFHYVHPALLSVAHLSDPACSQHMFGLGLNQSTNRRNDGNIASCLEDSSCLPGRPPRSLSPTG